MAEASQKEAEAILVTPEMIEAGVQALWPNDVLPTQDEAEVVTRIYQAMRRVEQALKKSE